MHTNTRFIIQYGKGKHGRYRVQYDFTGNLSEAINLYDRLKVYAGWKKRLLAPSLANPLVRYSYQSC